MIITIRSQATSEERAQLMALLCRIAGSQRPMATVTVDEREVIALDTNSLDAQVHTLIVQQDATESVLPIKTAYQLVSKAFKAKPSNVVVGDARKCTPTVIGSGATPVIMAGPCAVENREQLLSTARAVQEAGANILRG